MVHFQVTSTVSVQRQTNTRVTKVVKSSSSSSIVKQKSTVGLPKGHGGPGQLKGREESNGALIGGAVGASVAVILLCAIIAFFILSRRKKNK